VFEVSIVRFLIKSKKKNKSPTTNSHYVVYQSISSSNNYLGIKCVSMLSLINIIINN